MEKKFYLSFVLIVLTVSSIKAIEYSSIIENNTIKSRTDNIISDEINMCSDNTDNSFDLNNEESIICIDDEECVAVIHENKEKKHRNNISESYIEKIAYVSSAVDTDGDGIMDEDDIDDDNDGILDIDEGVTNTNVPLGEVLVSTQSRQLATYDLDTGATNVLCTTSFQANDISYNPVDGELYAIEAEDSFFVPLAGFYRIDLDTCAETEIGRLPALGQFVEPSGMTFLPDGTALVSYTRSSNIYRVTLDPFSATLWTDVGNGYRSAGDFIYANGVVYFTVELSTGPQRVLELEVDGSFNFVSATEIGTLDISDAFGLTLTNSCEVVVAGDDEIDIIDDITVNTTDFTTITNSIPDLGNILGMTSDREINGCSQMPVSGIDTDNDGVFNHLDIDSDNDGINDLTESSLDASIFDPDNNGVIDSTEFVDIDTDGLADGLETLFGNDIGVTPINSDTDALVNVLDLDSDNDGIPDAIEAQDTPNYATNFTNDGDVSDDDSDGDGAIDIHDGIVGHGGVFNAPQNTDTTGNPDYLDADSDDDGMSDSVEGGSGVTGVSYLDPNGSVNDPTINLPNETGDTSEVAYREALLSLTIDFDGINDYISTASFMNGYTAVSQMSWIRLNPSFINGFVIGNGQTATGGENSNLAEGTITPAGTIADDTNSARLSNDIEYTLVMNDDFGDGWDIGVLDVVVDGVSIGIFTVPLDTFTTTFSIPSGATIELIHEGGFNASTDDSFELSNANGIVHSSPLGSLLDLDITNAYTGTASCISCSSNDVMTLTLDDTIPLGTSITLSFARDDDNGNVTISDGTNNQNFSSGPNDALQHITFIAGQSTNQLTFSLNNGAVWIDGVEYEIADPSVGSPGYVMGQDNNLLWIESDGSLSGSVTTTNGTFSVNTTETLSGDIWEHVASVYDGNVLRLYINGEEEASVPATGTLGTSTNDFEIGRNPDTNNNYIHAFIDDSRVYDIALNEQQLQEQVYQEIEIVGGSIRGVVIPKNITNLAASNLQLYYQMDPIELGRVIDQSTYGRNGTLHNITTVEEQNAPMPYVANNTGNWTDISTWEFGDHWDITDVVNNKAWSIIQITNNASVTTVNNHTHLGLLVDNDSDFIVNNDSGVYNTSYVRLDGFIDLVGESQLIQMENSDLDITSSGFLEKDQQGTSDTYSYNIWSSPVSVINNTQVNQSYTIDDVMNDGTDPNNPVGMSYSGGFNGAPTAPITVSSYWMFKYSNGIEEFQQIGPFGSIDVGEGYTMKGPGTGAITDPQNYVFNGKPNNSTVAQNINIPTLADRDYIVGNPFASALDANDFINDNPHLNGTLYFWEHYGGGSHFLADYQAGYALYTLSGGTPAVSHPDVSQIGSGTKIPERYIAVGQGFFVTSDSDGNINFSNSQRNFVKEEGNSIFLFGDGINDDNQSQQSTSVNVQENNTSSQIPEYQPDDTANEVPDTRKKFRIGFESPSLYHRQLLLTVDENTTFGIDRSYDGGIEFGPEQDMTWDLEDKKFIILGVPNITEVSEFPLVVTLPQSGPITIGIDALENVDTETTTVYLRDRVQNTITNLYEGDYQITLDAGEHYNRYFIVFRTDDNEEEQEETETTSEEEEEEETSEDWEEETSGDWEEENEDTSDDEVEEGDETLSIEEDLDNETNTIAISYDQQQEMIVITKNNTNNINNVKLFSILGQTIKQWKPEVGIDTLQLSVVNLSKGPYIVHIETDLGLITEKIIVY